MKENAVAQLIFRARESLRTELRLVQVDPERLPEDCRRFLPLLAAHLDGQLKGARREETLEHLEGCERCQVALADMREASRRYRVILLPIGADEARAAVDERLEESGYWQTGGGRRLPVRRPALIVLGGAVGLLLAAAGTALGVELVRSSERAVLESVSTPAARHDRGADRGDGRGRDGGSDGPKPPPTTAAAKPKPAKKKVPKPMPAAKVKLKTKPTTTAAVLPPTTESGTTTTKLAPKPKSAPKPKPKPAPSPTPRPKQPKPKQPTPAPPPPAVTAAPDTTAPTVTITSAPGATSRSDVAEVAFQANEAGVAFACKLDAGAYAACTSPAHLTGLAAGAHSFSVGATDKAGNVGQPASVGWTYVPPDTTPPTAAITGGPSGSTTETSARFTFSADEAGSTFQCSLDGSAFKGCQNPASYSSLSPGSHSFSVKATDQFGNTGDPPRAPGRSCNRSRPGGRRLLAVLDHALEPREPSRGRVGPDHHLRRDVLRPQPAAGRLGDVLLVDVPGRDLCRSGGPNAGRPRIGRVEQHRQPQERLQITGRRRLSLRRRRVVPRSARVLERLGGVLALVGQALVFAGDVLDFLRIFLRGVHAAALVEHLLRLVCPLADEAHRSPFLIDVLSWAVCSSVHPPVPCCQPRGADYPSVRLRHLA